MCRAEQKVRMGMFFPEACKLSGVGKMLCEVCLIETIGSVRKIDFGDHPLCDDLVSVSKPDLASNQERYRQEIWLCENCLTAHQMHPVDKLVLFKPDYKYRAGLTKDVLNGMAGLVEKILATENDFTGRAPTILDIGCNDGSLLKIFKSRLNCITVGVDPSSAIQEAGDAIDFKFQGYFDEPIARAISESCGSPDLITLTNVFAHIENLPELLANLRILIGDSTKVVIENHYLGAIVSTGQFDTFYHEHPRTYSAKSFSVIADILGLEILELEMPSRYGGNIRVTMGRTLKESHQIELPDETYIPSQFTDLEQKFRAWKTSALLAIQELSKLGPFAGKGLPGRAVMLISALGLTEREMPFVFEQDSSPKVGHFVPGTAIQILPDSQMAAHGFRNLVVWPWHIFDEVRSYLSTSGTDIELWRVMPEFEKAS